jgi:post-segregation antitoxin (ccd killing protein)
MGNQISVIVPDEIRAKAKRAGLNISAECREHLKAKIGEYEKKYGRIPMEDTEPIKNADLVIEPSQEDVFNVHVDIIPIPKEDPDLIIEPSPESVFGTTEALSQITANKV